MVAAAENSPAPRRGPRGDPVGNSLMKFDGVGGDYVPVIIGAAVAEGLQERFGPLEYLREPVPGYSFRMRAPVAPVCPDEYRLIVQGEFLRIVQELPPAVAAHQILLYVRGVKNPDHLVAFFQKPAYLSQGMRSGEVTDHRDDPVLFVQLFEVTKVHRAVEKVLLFTLQVPFLK